MISAFLLSVVFGECQTNEDCGKWSMCTYSRNGNYCTGMGRDTVIARLVEELEGTARDIQDDSDDSQGFSADGSTGDEAGDDPLFESLMARGLSLKMREESDDEDMTEQGELKDWGDGEQISDIWGWGNNLFDGRRHAAGRSNGDIGDPNFPGSVYPFRHVHDHEHDSNHHHEHEDQSVVGQTVTATSSATHCNPYNQCKTYDVTFTYEVCVDVGYRTDMKYAIDGPWSCDGTLGLVDCSYVQLPHQLWVAGWTCTTV